MHEAYECEAKHCINDDMPRYKMTFVEGKIVSRVIMFPNLYVQIDYVNNVTIISRLEVCVLTNTVRIPRPLAFDPDNLPSLLEKVKTILTFS